ncbi:hypothetical protein EB796_022686 [Bugula neritina]|uniref:Uncharacterized protein n=1 Tax=Bugula neritina TaxID=10212 RepID=A0A7J7IYR4_BUGNE|nr:hypothetical protein EB796_022686 [Bugula neritina]
MFLCLLLVNVCMLSFTYLMVLLLHCKDHKAELRKFLLSYRSTPHSVTGVSPAELMLGRKLQTKLPCLEKSNRLDEEVRDRQAVAQEKSKSYLSNQAHMPDVSIGDEVLIRQNKTASSVQHMILSLNRLLANKGQRS